MLDRITTQFTDHPHQVGESYVEHMGMAFGFGRAMLLGGLGTLVPERRSEIASFGLRAVLAGTLSNLMSATLAGMFFALKAV